MAELQKDPITRKDFLGFGVLGAIVGAILTIPPVAFVLGPLIDVDVRGQSDVPSGPDDWFEVGPISEVPEGEPQVFTVKFPVEQVYGTKDLQKESGISSESFGVNNAIWVSWKAPVLVEGSQGSIGNQLGSPKRPAFLDDYDGSRPLTEDEVREAQDALNVLSSSCAHLGCPVRWREDQQLFLCPCHGGLYDINGGWYGGPPPRGMYSYTHEVRQDGNLYVRHQFDVGGGLNEQEPYVI
ncbi:MAG TPA: Rieske 2Fe-2S domain-containing protein [Rubrobacteraceae bacterium]|nr:Rieske 2Fe-2S domain-containing protein [Rubrobacteraceae bacterium]